MSSLEQIVLPLAESRALVEAGIVLETAMRWVKNHYNQAPFAIPVWFPPADGEVVLCPAPALSELLDAIRAKQPYAVVQCGDRPRGYVGSEKRACSAMQPEGCSDIRYGDTDLLAAYALLMEVAK